MIHAGYILPGKPHPFLKPEMNSGWHKLSQACEKVKKEVQESSADLILIYSTQWPSVIGHQIQALPKPKWIHVDSEWHELGEIPYEFKIDSEFAQVYQECASQRGLHSRTVSYEGFPIDTGSVVTLKSINPENKIPACIVSCNMYADRAETLVLGKAAADAIQKMNKKAIVIANTSFSNRMFTQPIDPSEDRIYSQKDDEWNRKLLSFLEEGRLEDVSQLAREFSAQAHVDQKFKAIWWLAAVMGQHNGYQGRVFEYQPVWGTGAAVVGLTYAESSGVSREFDEEDVEVIQNSDRVLSQGDGNSTPENGADEKKESKNIIHSEAAPAPVGSYPHARREGDFLYLSGIGPRDPKTNEVPGGPVKNKVGQKQDYDIVQQTEAVIRNIQTILRSSDSRLEDVVDVTVFLIDMDRDFKGFNEVYRKYFQEIQATRTTVAVSALPTPIAVEFKVVAKVRS